jgi:hypothetical protein
VHGPVTLDHIALHCIKWRRDVCGLGVVYSGARMISWARIGAQSRPFLEDWNFGFGHDTGGFERSKNDLFRRDTLEAEKSTDRLMIVWGC